MLCFTTFFAVATYYCLILKNVIKEAQGTIVCVIFTSSSNLGSSWKNAFALSFDMDAALVYNFAMYFEIIFNKNFFEIWFNKFTIPTHIRECTGCPNFVVIIGYLKNYKK